MTVLSALSDTAEMDQLTALQNMAILDTRAQRDFDEFTRLTALTLNSVAASATLLRR